MQSTRSFFNRAIFAKTVKRYWPMWALYLLIWIIALCTCTRSAIHYSIAHLYTDDVLQFTWLFGLFMSIAACCLSAMLVHSWMYNSRNAGAYSALPVSRPAMFISVTLAGIVPLIACNFIASLAAWLVAALSGFNIALTALQCFLVLSLECLFFYGLAALCATLTGHVFVLPALYAIFNFLVVVVEMLVKTLMGYFAFGAVTDSAKLDFLSPFIYLVDNVNVVTYDAGNISTFETWLPFIIYAAVGIVLAAAGLFIFRRRRMESASDVVAVNVLKPVFKYCLCLGCALVLGLLLFSIIASAFLTNSDPAASVVVCICMLVGGFIGYFAAEMLLKKSFKVFRRTWKGYLICGAVIILFVTAIETDLFGYERRIPEMEDVESVEVQLWGEPTTFTESSDIADIILLHERIINDKTQTEKNLHRYYSDNQYSYVEGSYTAYVSISYQLDNGSVLERRYTLLYNASDKFFIDLLNTLNQPDAIISRIENSIDSEYMEMAYIYYNYRTLADNTPKEAYITEEYYEAIDAAADMGITIREEHRMDDPEVEHVNGNLQLNAQQARALYENAVMKDARNGDIGRVLPDDNGYKGKININIEFSARKPSGTPDSYEYQYIYMQDITEDAKYTVAALKELGIDLEALASSAIE